jgi:NAD(P)H dehydrogenase (quinone)
MNVLYVYAHQEPKSFNSSMKDTALEAFEKRGDSVKVSDLYAMNFDPVLDENDFKNRKYTDVFNPFLEQLHANKTDSFAPDIKAEMDKINWADMLIFQFPLYFTGFPAIMKGWIDRVFSPGFAFNPLTQSAYETGLLKGKKAMLVTTAGADKDWYSKGGIHGDIHELLKSITHCTLEFTGLEVLPTHVVYGASNLSEDDAKKELGKYRELVLSL